MSAFEAVVPPIGEVFLEDKQIPLHEWEDREAAESKGLVFTRATIDITPLKNKVLSLPPDIWEDENQEGNVQLKRPAHDAWGIKKIVFTFCDDFIMKVLDLPWSRDEEWKSLLTPIYEAIGIDQSRVIRSLFARMPPQMEIPVHHDTGYWVKHGHRIHVPIITSDEEVDFFVGPSDDKLKKYLFSEGSIVELNNQAKHKVKNNMKDTWRVHLIFDYVDEHPVNRYAISAGQVINQTRRSLDLAGEESSRPSPAFIILGAQKAGTTSLYEYICQHPLVVKGKRRETHYFDWRWNNRLSTGEEHHNYYMNFYNKDALAKYPSLATGESTPSYLLHSDIVIPRVKMVCPDTKFLVMLRNPTARAFSQYQMSIDQSGTEEQKAVRGMSAYSSMSFEEAIDMELAELAAIGIKDGHMIPYEDFKTAYLSSRPMNHGGHSLISRGLYALQLQPWLAAFPGQIKICCIGDVKGDKHKVQGFMDDVFSFIGLPQNDVENLEARNTRAYDVMSDSVRAKLDAFYAPYNDMLAKLLEETTGKSLDVSHW